MENNLIHVAHDWRNRIGIKKEYTRVKILNPNIINYLNTAYLT